MKRKRLTVKEFLECKGKRQLSVLFVHNVEEASAAEEAGIDMIIAAYDIPQYGIHATLNDVHPVKVMKSGGTVVTVIRVKQRFCKFARLFPSSTDTRQWIVRRVLLSLKWPSKHSG